MWIILILENYMRRRNDESSLDLVGLTATILLRVGWSKDSWAKGYTVKANSKAESPARQKWPRPRAENF